MSRSYRKHPCYHIGCPSNKRVANRLVRRYKGDMGNYSFYKKLYESYDIIDWIWYDESQVKQNKEFRRVARIIRSIYNGKLSLDGYDIKELMNILIDTKNSFYFVNK